MEKKNTEARIRANNKYNAKTYKTFTVNAKISDYDVIQAYCDARGISKAKFLIAAAKYAIDNDIDVIE